ncbi:ABC transporter substrate-binding protein [Alkalibacillus aidingensis]|uniref:ABC transporter substrate-binding protein n=1 Tax=Alkalibacillus aidingensis TaxID=2747607 RepID=UPI001CB72F7C|nr:iron-siderophore ABC transporter substrate-binding protein [Alkalibacillus aidingensis]
MKNMKLKSILALMFVLILGMLLAACNSDQEEPVEDGDSTEEISDHDDDESEETNENITISGALGDVELEEEAETVVALEWTYAEDLLAVGHQPAGVADIDGFHQYVNINETLGEDVVDVGTRQEPSLEAISALDPDLIIAIEFRHEGIQEQLESIAPTVFFNPYPEEGTVDQYTEMEDTFKEIAKAVGESEQAENILADLEETYAEARTTLEEAELGTYETILTYGWSADQAPVFRLFTQNSMVSQIMEQIGLENPYESEEFEAYGYSEVNLEAFTNFEDANYLYVVESGDDLYEDLADHSVWSNLNFVEEGRTYDIGSDTWLFGGPLAAEVFVEQVVESMVSE